MISDGASEPDNNYLRQLGIGSAFIALFDPAHPVMNVFSG